MLTLIILFLVLRMMSPWRWHRPWGMYRGGPGFGMWHRPPMGGPRHMGGFGPGGPYGFGPGGFGGPHGGGRF